MDVRQFNFIYKQLVSGPDDIVGLIAYGLYKQKKIEYIEKYCEEHEVLNIPEEDLNHFHDSSSHYKQEHIDKAVNLLENFLEESLANAIDETKKDFDDQLQQKIEENDKELERKIKELRPPFWPGCFQSLVGSLMLLLVVGAIFAILVGYRIGFEDFLQEIITQINYIDPQQLKTRP